VIEQVASKKSTLLLKMENPNAQTLQLLTERYKTEKFITEDTLQTLQILTERYKTEKYLQKLLKCRAKRFGCRYLAVKLKVVGSASAFKREYLD